MVAVLVIELFVQCVNGCSTGCNNKNAIACECDEGVVLVVSELGE